MANSRQPNAWTPLDRDELAELKRELTRKSVEQLRKDFALTIEMCKLPYGLNDALPRPFLIQELVQIWKELYRRSRKNRR